MISGSPFQDIIREAGVSQLSLEHNIFDPRLLTGSQSRLLTDRLNIFYENGTLAHELYVLLATAAATQIIIKPTCVGHQEGLMRLADRDCAALNTMDLTEAERIFAKSMMTTILYLRKDRKNGTKLLFLDEECKQPDIAFIRSLKDQGEKFNDELHGELGFARNNAGDIQYFAHVPGDKDLVASFLPRAQLGNLAFFELAHEFRSALQNGGVSKTLAKRLDDLHKNFKVAAVTLEEMTRVPIITAVKAGRVSVPYGTPNYS